MRNEDIMATNTEIIRCINCTHGEPYMAGGNGITEPPYIQKIKCEIGIRTYPEDFCSYGEGKSNE